MSTDVNINNVIVKIVGLYDENGEVINLTNPLNVVLAGRICEENTSIIPLDADEVFLGEDWQDTLDYGTVSIGINTDQDSITDGLVIQWSANGIDIDDDDTFTISANNGKTFTFGPARRYVRLKYTNGSTPQTFFRLETTLRRVFVKPSSHRVGDPIIGEDDASLIIAVSTGLAPDGTYKNVLVTNSGNQKISLEEFEDQVSVNSNTQLRVTEFDSLGNELDPPSGPANYFSTYLLDGSNVDMAVDGTVPVDYSYTVPEGKGLLLTRTFLTLEDGVTAFNPGDFGALSALIQGVEFSITPNGESKIVLENWKTNRQLRDTMFDFDTEFKKDGAYIGRWSFDKDMESRGIRLNAGDVVNVRVQENLDGLDYLAFRIKGRLEDV